MKMKLLLINIVSAVLLVGCEPPTKDIKEAVRQKNYEAAKQFIAAGVDVNVKDRSGSTPLHWAATKVMAELLIANGADVNAQRNDRWTPLHWAISQEIEFAELLIANGANVNAQTVDGWTPLHQAAYMELAESAELLIASGANINAKSYYLQTRERRGDQTPLEVAIESGDTKIAALLRKNGGKTSEELKSEAK